MDDFFDNFSSLENPKLSCVDGKYFWTIISCTAFTVWRKKRLLYLYSKFKGMLVVSSRVRTIVPSPKPKQKQKQKISFFNSACSVQFLHAVIIIEKVRWGSIRRNFCHVYHSLEKGGKKCGNNVKLPWWYRGKGHRYHAIYTTSIINI